MFPQFPTNSFSGFILINFNTRIGSSKLVIVGGLAELVAGMISMGLGQWLSSNTTAKQWDIELERERREVIEQPLAEEREIYEIFEPYNIPPETVKPIVEHLMQDPEQWVQVGFFESTMNELCLLTETQFMMAFELKLEKPRRRTAVICALIMGFTYLLGGIIPMIPYFAFKNVNHALFTSIGITVVVLLVFGYMKARIAGVKGRARFTSAFETLVVGVLAAGTSYGIVYGINKRLSGNAGIA
jgi:VIT1/CCC1 family predicted Fe2+/Mn2+ transporter